MPWLLDQIHSTADAVPHPDRPAICAFIGVVGGGMSAIAMRSAITAAS